MNETWAEVPDGSGFTVDNLPFGVATDARGHPTIVARIGDHAVAVADVVPDVDRALFATDRLNPFLAAGATTWRATRDRLQHHLTDPARARALTPVADLTLARPMVVGDYVDFYASLHHATNLGRILRPDDEPLLDNWRHLPVGYHGRSGTIVVSGTPVTRPGGLVSDGGPPLRRLTRALDFELEVGFVVGPPNPSGRPIAPDEAADHVFGVVLVNDWSARDIQSYEYRPLGPFLGKSFLTSISPWVVPLDALTGALVAPPTQDPEPDPFLRAEWPWGLALEVTAAIDRTIVCRTSFAHTYWTFAQQLAHLTSNGATVAPGDLFASGTVSGPTRGERGSLIEATWRGAEPLTLHDGTTRCWLLDGDTVTLAGHAGGAPGTTRIDLGEVTGTIAPGHVRRPDGEGEGP